MPDHDIHDFVISCQKDIEQEYSRIRRRATEDPGTAGDQGEENWASLLRSWLPSYFHIVTKGRIITESGYASPQVDVLVLHPSYPRILLDKKLYISGGVAAAFECKLTLTAEHVKTAVETAAKIRRNLPKRKGTPYKELTSTIIYGLLAHSHSWKCERSRPIENIETALTEADQQCVQHPIECIDLVTVADLATWTMMKGTYTSPKLPFYNDEFVRLYGPNGYASTGFVCCGKGDPGTEAPAWHENQADYFSPLGVLLSSLFSKLAWILPDMRPIEEYFRKVNLMGRGGGKGRLWGLEIYSEEIRERVYNGHLSNGIPFDEWSVAF